VGRGRNLQPMLPEVSKELIALKYSTVAARRLIVTD
jgi:hypothetical protein